MTTRPSRLAALVTCAGLTLGAAPVVAADGPPAAVVQRVQGCSQWVFSIQAPAERVRPLVPARWIFSRDAIGKAMLSYRMFRCDRVVLDGRRLSHVVWSELGVRLLPPDGVPEVHADTHVDGHDYYMLFLHTPSRFLAQRLASLGVPASLVPAMTYELSKDGEQVFVRSREGSPGKRYEVQMKTGPVTSPLRQDVGVRSWHEDAHRVLRGHEVKPCVLGTLSNSRLRVDAGTLLARLMDTPPQPDGSKKATSATDPWLAFNSTTQYALVQPPAVTDADPLHEVSLPCVGGRR